MSLLKVGAIQDTAGANSNPVADLAKGRAKAWVLIDGTVATATALNSFNVASTIDTGVGDYSAVFSTPMSTANYVSQVTYWALPGTAYDNGMVREQTTSQVRAFGVYASGAAYDAKCCITVDG